VHTQRLGLKGAEAYNKQSTRFKVLAIAAGLSLEKKAEGSALEIAPDRRALGSFIVQYSSAYGYEGHVEVVIASECAGANATKRETGTPRTQGWKVTGSRSSATAPMERGANAVLLELL